MMSITKWCHPQVNINWKMLTMARPTNNIDTSFFSRWNDLHIQKIFRFCLFRLVELTRLKLATTRKEEKERSINSIISPSLPSAVLPCFLPILSHHCFSAEKLNHEVVTGRDLTIVCIFIISPLKLPISGCFREWLFISPPSLKLLLHHCEYYM